jgi:hypothetical protein
MTEGVPRQFPHCQVWDVIWSNAADVGLRFCVVTNAKKEAEKKNFLMMID